ncbi:MAG: carbohydrate ABC transporter permease [Acidimicrobiales bacterium]
MERVRTWGPGLLLVSPSILLIAVFVYGMIGWNIKVSLSDWRQALPTSGYVGLENYRQLWDDQRWTGAVEHAVLFTAVFVAGSLVMGAAIALLLDKGVKGEGFFRSIYLFPMAVSFIASGIVWRWLMNPAPGDRASGLNVIFNDLGLDFLANDWWQSRSWGMAAMAMPAIWQLSGYIMALYLAGLRGVPEELREAARMDGASEWKVYRHVVFPHLRPITLSALIILGHISIKVFDLIVAIAGKQIIADMPAVYMWQLIFDARNAAKGAAIATLLLIGIAVLTVPYLVYTVRSERQA